MFQEPPGQLSMNIFPWNSKELNSVSFFFCILIPFTIYLYSKTCNIAMWFLVYIPLSTTTLMTLRVGAMAAWSL